MNKRTVNQQRVRKAIVYLKDYMNTYDRQVGYLDYSDDTIINDVLYGLGVALGGKKYEYADGFARWKAVLREKLLVENRVEAAHLTHAQFGNLNEEGQKTITAWRDHVLQARAKGKDFELDDIPRSGRWLPLSAKKAWKPKEGKVYLFKNKGDTVNPYSIMKAAKTKNGIVYYEVLWAAPCQHPSTHVWIKK